MAWYLQGRGQSGGIPQTDEKEGLVVGKRKAASLVEESWFWEYHSANLRAQVQQLECALREGPTEPPESLLAPHTALPSRIRCSLEIMFSSFNRPTSFGGQNQAKSGFGLVLTWGSLESPKTSEPF